MPVIPTITAKAGIEGATKIVPKVDYNVGGIARAGAMEASNIQNAGKVVEEATTAYAGHIAKRTEENNAFKANMSLEKFQQEQEAEDRDAVNNMDPNAEGFAEGRSAAFEARSKALIESLPESQRERATLQVEKMRTQHLGATAKTELAARQTHQADSLEQTLKERQRRIIENPDAAAGAIEEVDQQIDQTVLPLATKSRLKQEARKRIYDTEFETTLQNKGPAAAKSLPSGPVTEQVWSATLVVESAGDKFAKSKKGALGLAQVMPDTARMIARQRGDNHILAMSDQEMRSYFGKNPDVNVAYGRSYFDAGLKEGGGDYRYALIYYNAGPGRARQWKRAGEDFSILPMETQKYVPKILNQVNLFGDSERSDTRSTAKIGGAIVNIDRHKQDENGVYRPASGMKKVSSTISVTGPVQASAMMTQTGEGDAALVESGSPAGDGGVPFVDRERTLPDGTKEILGKGTYDGSVDPNQAPPGQVDAPAPVKAGGPPAAVQAAIAASAKAPRSKEPPVTITVADQDEDGNETYWNLPTIVGGKRLDPDEVIERWRRGQITEKTGARQYTTVDEAREAGGATVFDEGAPVEGDQDIDNAKKVIAGQNIGVAADGPKGTVPGGGQGKAPQVEGAKPADGAPAQNPSTGSVIPDGPSRDPITIPERGKMTTRAELPPFRGIRADEDPNSYITMKRRWEAEQARVASENKALTNEERVEFQVKEQERKAERDKYIEGLRLKAFKREIKQGDVDQAVIDGKLSVSEGEMLVNDLIRRDSRIEKRSKEDQLAFDRQKGAVKLQMDDDLASIRKSGIQLKDINTDTVDKYWGPEIAVNHEIQRAHARKFFEATDGLKDMSRADMDKRIESLKPKGGERGFAYAEKIYEEAQKMGAQILKARGESDDDPVKEIFSGRPFSGFNGDHRKTVNAAYESLLEKAPPEARLNVLNNVVKATGMVPTSFVEFARTAIVSTEKGVAEAYLQVANNLLVQNPNAFAGAPGGEDLARSTLKFRHYVDTVGNQKAVARIIEENDPRFQDKSRRAIEEGDLRKELKTIREEGGDRLARELDGDGWAPQWMGGYPTPGATLKEEDRLVGDYSEIFRDEYIRNGGNAALAKSAATENVKRNWGVSYYTGQTQGVLMKYPVERAYPAFMGSHDWLTDQARADIKAKAGHDVKKGDIVLIPDDKGMTQKFYSKAGADGPVPYVLAYYRERDGQRVLETTNSYFVGDYKKHLKENTEKAQAIADRSMATGRRVTNTMNGIPNTK